MAADTERDMLVPVGDSETLRRTVGYVVESAHEAAVETGETTTVHFVLPARWRVFETNHANVADAESLLERVVAWANEDLNDVLEEDEPRNVAFKSAVIGTGEYIFSPGDFAAVVHNYANANGVSRVVVDPSFRPGGTVPILRSFEEELARMGLDVVEAPVTRRTRRSLPFTDVGLPAFLFVFSISLVFYIALGSFHVTDGYELVTGVVTAGAVTATLARISMKGRVPEFTSVARTVGRMVIYTPILLWEVAKANVTLAYVVLHPSLPINPSVVEFDAAVWGDMPVTTLANSITLTPGTLTVDVNRQHFVIHALIPTAEADLLEGKLERLVRFVFYGRSAARIPSPLERRRDDEEGGD